MPCRTSGGRNDPHSDHLTPPSIEGECMRERERVCERDSWIERVCMCEREEFQIPEPPPGACVLSADETLDAPLSRYRHRRPTRLPLYTLHPTLYTLQPTPYTLHPQPFTLHPTPSTLLSTPHSTAHSVLSTLSSTAYPTSSVSLWGIGCRV